VGVSWVDLGIVGNGFCFARFLESETCLFGIAIVIYAAVNFGSGFWEGLWNVRVAGELVRRT
jgi:hypothetical protein